MVTGLRVKRKSKSPGNGTVAEVRAGAVSSLPGTNDGRRRLDAGFSGKNAIAAEWFAAGA
jgi:hypothetical protein